MPPEVLNGGNATTPTTSNHNRNNNISPQSSSVSLSTKNKKNRDDIKRLVEYFIIVSSIPREVTSASSSPSKDGKRIVKVPSHDSNDSSNDYFDLEPVITGRFPLEDHDDNPLVSESITCFCHPSENIRPLRDMTMPKVHFFVATGGTGQRMYGTCLTLYEPYEIPDTSTDDSSTPITEVFVPKCLCILSSWPYLTAFREYLTQLNRFSKSGSMTVPIERCVINFCSEIPAPPPGSFEVQTTMLDSVIKLWSPPHNQPIQWVSLPFSQLFQCLDLNNILTVWHALALERQVLISSTQISLLTTIAEIFCSLLFPMKWSHAYIPVVPHFLVPILTAPMPFFCGIDKSNLPEALLGLSEECILVDLDKNFVTMGPMTPPLPDLPAHHMSAVKASLEENAGMIFKEVRCLRRKDNIADMGQHLPSHLKKMADAAWEGNLCLSDEAFHLYFTPEEARKNLLNGNGGENIDYSNNAGSDDNIPLHIRVMSKRERSKLKKQSNWDAVQECFLGTYVYMLRNFRKYLVFPSKNEDGTGVLDSLGAGFRTKEFVKGQRYDMQPFLEELCKTQQFDDFITKRLYGSGESDVIFFDKAIDKMMKGEAGNPISNRFRLNRSRNVESGFFGGNKEPLLQSSGVRRKLKTVVPPEPSSRDLPPPPPSMMEAVAIFQKSEEYNAPQDNDDISVISTHSAGSYSYQSGKSGKSRDRNSILIKETPVQNMYVYPTFPSTFDPELFGAPRPLPSAVLAEFARQRENAARFRRKVSEPDVSIASGATAGLTPSQIQMGKECDGFPCAEVSTFTLFFMTFTALVGKELNKIAQEPDFGDDDRTILSSIEDKSVRSESKKQADDPGCEASAGGDAESATEMSEMSEDKPVVHETSQEKKEDSGSSEETNEEEGSEEKNASTASTNPFGDEEADDQVKDIAGESATNPFGDKEGETLEEKDDEQSTDASTNPFGDNDQESTEQSESNESSTNSVEDDDKESKDNEANIENSTNPFEDEEKIPQTKDEGNAPPTNPFGDETEEEKQAEKDSSTVSSAITASSANPFEEDDDTKENQQQDNNTQTPRESEAAKHIIPSPEFTTPIKQTTSPTSVTSPANTQSSPLLSRNRFRDTLSNLEIEEAKATAKAELGLAFDILQMMRERSLNADPAAYQCLIDACGRCGDTERATMLLSRMHEDGIVADGVVYSSLVSAFSAENSWNRMMRKDDENVPEWANGATLDMNWNDLRKNDSYLEQAKKRLSALEENTNLGARANRLVNRLRGKPTAPLSTKPSPTLTPTPKTASTPSNPHHQSKANQKSNKNKKDEMIVTEPVLMQILLGANLLELIYPDISIETDVAVCPRCSKRLNDNEVVSGWYTSDAQDYTTHCPNCRQKFVPHFSVQSTSPSFVGSRGPSSALLCERLSPWVLQKELRNVMADPKGIEGVLKPEWREEESRNATLWWNLVISFMRYRLPISFLLQGSFQTSLITPTPIDQET